MITKFKKGSYKISLAAILLVLVLGAVLLTDALDDGKGAKLDTSIKAEVACCEEDESRPGNGL
ncbi:hypothetical protein [Paenibacillus senegalensis]|uniref:hypothetical protein n=1 Tax=Paenibacillus senegalensis TaxID=1465766 RepID=UPI0003093B4F|nr:hypothetical protein [Paenibacillus senegalensis]